MMCAQYILNLNSCCYNIWTTVISLFIAHRWFCVCTLDWVIIAECIIINNT